MFYRVHQLETGEVTTSKRMQVNLPAFEIPEEVVAPLGSLSRLGDLFDLRLFIPQAWRLVFKGMLLHPESMLSSTRCAALPRSELFLAFRSGHTAGKKR